uniref:Myb-like domain-containing protein n=1 Tax=Brassica oleracea var. oleracea TaxID=109376 RepID=A0A0D3C2B0_BRAOL
MDLLNHQQPNTQPSVDISASNVSLFGPWSEEENVEAPTVEDRKERRKWTPTEDHVLISAWLNTSKDPVVGNVQKAIAFWKRIAAYFAASPKLSGLQTREPTHCKQRWGKINEGVCKFVGCYVAATKEKSSGQNENDKWCGASTTKDKVQSKRRKLDEHSAQSSTSVAGEDDQSKRPIGVKAAKAKGKRAVSNATKLDEEEKELQSIWDMMDERFDEIFDQRFENLLIHKEAQQEASRSKKKRAYIERQREQGHMQLWNDYFSEDATYPSHMFRHRFRMNKPLFMRIVDRPSAEIPYFQQRRDATGRFGHSPLQKATTSIRMMAYGFPADAVDEYLRLGETTALLCSEHFVQRIINIFGDEYLRRTTPEDLQRLLDIGEIRGFPGMIGSIDCMHWEWKNCPTAWKGTLNDINILDRSPVFDDILQGRAPKVNYIVNENAYHLAYYLTDGIYPKWATFVQSIPLPQGPKASLFATHQEAVRKDVERAFGVLQARFSIVKNPALLWDKIKIGKIMRACIILHNMIVEDERDEYTQFDVSVFAQPESNRSSQVDFTYSTDMPSNLGNMMSIRNRVRDRTIHHQLKADLVEHIWQKFGTNQDFD